MFLMLLSQIAEYGLLALGVMAANAIVFVWLGGRWGLLVGELYLMLFLFNQDLNILRVDLNFQFFTLWLLHVVLINLMLLPAWGLGLLLRQDQRVRSEAARLK